LSLLGGQTREILRAAVVLDRAKAHANQLQHEVRHDGLTGLANRAFLLETLEQRIKSRSGTALFFIDLDGFKSLNDTIGHRAGDAALVTVSERLNALAPTGSLVGRMGGDEFIVMTPVGRTDTLETLHRFGDSVAQLIGEPMLCDGHEARVGASVGLAVHDGVVGADQLISRADAAMYEAKRDGGGLRVDPKSAGLERKDRSLL
jgi:diguanylate cyclase (GGDEF)-like protein